MRTLLLAMAQGLALLFPFSGVSQKGPPSTGMIQNTSRAPVSQDVGPSRPGTPGSSLVKPVFRRGDKLLTSADSLDPLAYYTVSLNGLRVGTLAIQPAAVALDPTRFVATASATAHSLLLGMRQAAGEATSGRRAVGKGSRWAHILFPHGSVWPWRWHFGANRRSYRLGYQREREDIARFEYDLMQLLLAERRRVGLAGPGAAATGDAPAGPAVTDDQLPVVLNQQTLGLVRREPDPTTSNKYRLALLAPGIAYHSAAWTPQATPGTEAIVDTMLNATFPGLRLAYTTASEARLRRLLKPGSSLSLLRTRAEAIKRRSDELNNLLINKGLANQQQASDLYERYTGAQPALQKVPTALKLLARKAQLATAKRDSLLLGSTSVEEAQKALRDYEITKPAPDSAKRAQRTAALQALLVPNASIAQYKAAEDNIRAFTNGFNNQPADVRQAAGSPAELQGKLLAARADSVKLFRLLQRGTDLSSFKAAYDGRVAAGGELSEVLLPTAGSSNTPAYLEAVAQQVRSAYPGDADLRASLRDALARPVAQLLARILPLPELTASNTPNLLFNDQLLLPTQPDRRLARLYIHDRSSNAPAANQARYAICLQYSATSGTYEDIGTSLLECRPTTGYVGVSTELAVLERSAFVNQLFEAIVLKMRLLESTANELKADNSLAATNRAELLRKQLIPGLLEKLDKKESSLTQKPATIIEETTAEHSLRESLRDFYDNFIRSQERLAETPRAGTVLLGQRLMTYYHKEGATNEYFEVDSVGVEVEDGSAMGIKAYGTYRGRQLLFETYAPLDLSSDYALNHQWYRQRMYAQSSLLQGSRPDYDRVEQGLYIHLHELLRYYPVLLARTSDRSPANAVYVFRPQDPLPRRILRKDPTSKLLQARIYSDLVGLTGDRPNGLVQAEITKKFLLSNSFINKLRMAQCGFFNYIQPMLTVNKIEDNEKYLQYQLPVVAPASGIDPRKVRLVRTIDLLRYTNVRIGVAQNLAHLKSPKIKSDFSFDYSVSLSRVAVRDPQAINQQKDRDSTLNMVTYGPQLVWRIRPDSRFGAQLRTAVLLQKLFNNVETSPAPGSQPAYRVNVIQEDYGTLEADRGHTLAGKVFRTTGQTILQFELLLWATVSDNSELFFRTQFSTLRYATYQTYFQMQLGYQFDVFTNRRTAVKPVGLFPK
jgi:hypothetical protein